MEVPRLLELLGSIHFKSDRNSFINFIKSPYLNGSEKAELQANYVSMIWNLMDEKREFEWDEPEILKKIFPVKADWEENRLNKFKTSIANLFRQYIAEEVRRKQTRADENEYLWLLNAYRERGFLDHYHSLAKNYAKTQNENKELSLEKLFNDFRISRELSFVGVMESNKKNDGGIQDAIRKFDLCWLANRLRWECALMNQAQFTPLDGVSEQSFFRKIMLDSAGNPPTDHPLVGLFHGALGLFDQDEQTREQHFESVRILLNQHKENLNSEVISDLEALMNNFCARQINVGKMHYREQLFETQRTRLESGRLFYNNAILASDFYSLAIIGLRLNHIEWVFSFLNQYKNQILEQTVAKEVVRLCWAHYYFYVKDFNACLKNLKETYTDVYYKSMSKILRIMVVFELDSKKLDLDKLLNAEKVHFHREQAIPKERKKAWSRFIDVVTRLQNLRHGNNINRLEKLKTEVESDFTIAERQWLLEKIDQCLEQHSPKKSKK